MSFPHSNNSLNEAVKQLKEVVSRHQGEDHESTSMVREIEAIVADIERKAVNISFCDRGSESQITTPVMIRPNPLPAI